MPHQSRLANTRGIVVAALVAGAALAMPRVASSQARGILQVTATVVQAQAGFDGLKAANQAVLYWATNGQQVTNDVSTVAQVTITSGADAREQATADLVVNIDYVKN